MSFDAMLFAAGLGTRLRPLTHRIPKALVPVAGVPMLERVARRVIDAGADRLIVNVHHHAERIVEFIHERDGFGVEVRISMEEDEPLETGGGLLAAREHFRMDRTIVIHNTDVLTNFRLRALLEAHDESGALATLAVMQRDKSRALIFDEDGLCGAVDLEGTEATVRPPVGRTEYLGFCGVQAVRPSLIDRIEERGIFSIIGPYLRLAGAGEPILPHRVDDADWFDIGTHERLEEADRFASGTGTSMGAA